MSVVLKNRKEFDMVFSWVKDHFKKHVNVIAKNSYLEDKFERLTLDCLVPTDYFVDGPPQPEEKPKKEDIETITPTPSVKFKAFQTLSDDLRDKKVLLTSVNGCQLFNIHRQAFLPEPNVEVAKPTLPTSLVDFAKGYAKKLLMSYDFKTLLSIAFFYGCMLLMQIFTASQLIVFSAAVVFAVIKFDLYLTRARAEKPSLAPDTPPQELYAKRLVSFSRPELKDYLETRTKTIKMHSNRANPSEKATK